MSLLAETLRKKTKLSEKKVAQVVAAYRPFPTRHNQLLLRKGEVSKYLYFVEKGYLRVFVTDASGNQFTRFLIEAGVEGTAFPSFIEQKPSTASIQCVGKAEVLRISHDDVLQLHKAIPGFGQLYHQTIERAYIDAIRRIESLISLHARERYQLLLREKPMWIQQLPANVIAEYLGISKETLSRLKAAR